MCDTIQSLCEYLLTYSSLTEEIFVKRTLGVGGGGKYSVQWPIQGGSAQKELKLFGLHVYKMVGVY